MESPAIGPAAEARSCGGGCVGPVRCSVCSVCSAPEGAGAIPCPSSSFKSWGQLLGCLVHDWDYVPMEPGGALGVLEQDGGEVCGGTPVQQVGFLMLQRFYSYMWHLTMLLVASYLALNKALIIESLKITPYRGCVSENKEVA